MLHYVPLKKINFSYKFIYQSCDIVEDQQLTDQRTSLTVACLNMHNRDIPCNHIGYHP